MGLDGPGPKFRNPLLDKTAESRNPVCGLAASVAQLVEQLTLNQLVLGSSPSRGTNFSKENEQSGKVRTDSAQLPGVARHEVTFPHTIHRGRLSATIYGKSKGGEPKKDGSVTRPYQFYRMTVTVAGKRVMRSFATFAAAKAAAKAKLKELAKGNQSAGLSAKEAADALTIRQALDAFYRETGRNPFTVLLSVVHDPGCHTRCILDQFFVVF